MLETLQNADRHVSEIMLAVELKRISIMPVLFLFFIKLVSCWLASLHIVHCHVANIAQDIHCCEVTIKDFVTNINSQLFQGQYNQQCVVEIDETNFILTWNMD